MAVRYAGPVVSGPRRVTALLAVIMLGIGATQAVADELAAAPAPRLADLGHGIAVHYVEQGSGPTVVFVHGSLGDYTYWNDQLAAFAARYHAVAYSRRYSYPNQNPARAGYSAVVDAEDLAAFIRYLHVGRVYVVGHSYGALTGLFLAVRHPELLRALVLAEPPAVSLLQDVPSTRPGEGRRMYADIEKRMVAPMRAAFAAGDTSAGVGVFIDYVFHRAHAWETMPPEARDETLRDAHEWEVMMTTGTLFPRIEPRALERVRLPVLLMSGGKSYPFLNVIDEDLVRLIPGSRRIVYPDAGHQMWYQQPARCRADVEAFFAGLEPTAAR